MTHPTLGRRLRAAREHHGWTQEDLALRVAVVGRAVIGAIERGDYEPSIQAVIVLARTLGVSTDSLLLGEADVTEGVRP